MAAEPARLVVAITGASGAIYGVRLLEMLREAGVKTHLVISKSARLTIAHEVGDITRVVALADVHYAANNMAAAISSGSFRTLGMIIAPCSMNSLAEIAAGVTTSLVSRAADVVLKERRRLVLLVRETPLHLGHLRNMASITEMGGVIYPPTPGFYANPVTLQDMVDHTLGRVLDLFDLNLSSFRRWGEDLGLENQATAPVASSHRVGSRLGRGQTSKEH